VSGPQGKQPLVVELVGLPGAGKTTLERSLTIPHAGRRTIPFWRTPLTSASLAVLWHAFALAIAVRPFRISQLRRAFAVFFMLRAHANLKVPLVVLDQGLVQKVWSMIVEADGIPQARLNALIKACGDFGPVTLVFLKSSPELASTRIMERPSGNSRFDGSDTAASDLEILRRGISLYEMLLSNWPGHSLKDTPTIAADLPLKKKVSMLEALIAEKRSG